MRISRHHLLQTELGSYAQLSSVFFNHAPQLIAFKWSKSHFLYEIIVHLLCMFSQVFQQSANGITMMSSNPFNTSYPILLYQMLAYVDYFILRQVFPVKWGVRCLDKPGTAVIAVVLLMPCPILPPLNNVLSMFLQKVSTFQILTGNFNLTPRSRHNTSPNK